jgi:hypothetical protein
MAILPSWAVGRSAFDNGVEIEPLSARPLNLWRRGAVIRRGVFRERTFTQAVTADEVRIEQLPA